MNSKTSTLQVSKSQDMEIFDCCLVFKMTSYCFFFISESYIVEYIFYVSSKIKKIEIDLKLTNLLVKLVTLVKVKLGTAHILFHLKQ